MLKKILVRELYLPVIYIIFAFIIYFVLSKIVNRLLVINKNKSDIKVKREKTIVNLIKNIIKYVIAVITFLGILNVYGVETKSIIASLGIAGAVIGLAFQDIIKNLLSGITIIFDDHYVQGDIVTINGFKGEVIELGLQTTKLKSYEGEVLIISNHLITSVINHSMCNTNIFLDLKVNKEISIKEIESILKKVSDKLQKRDDVHKPIDLLGVEVINDNNYIYKILIECDAEHQYQVNRAFAGFLKEEYDKIGIDVPSDIIEIKEK